MSRVENFIISVNKTLKEEKKSALKSLRKLEQAKKVKSEEIRNDLKAISSRAIKLKPILKSINQQLGSLKNTENVLRLKRMKTTLQQKVLRKDIKGLYGVEKEIHPLKDKIKILQSRKDIKAVKQKILSKQVKAMQSKLTRLNGSLTKLTTKQINPLQRKISDLIRRKIQKETMQKRIKSLVKKLPVIKQKILTISQREMELAKKRASIAGLNAQLREIQKRKQQQKIKLITALKKIREQEKKIAKIKF